MVKSQVLLSNPFATMNKIFSMELQRGKKILDPFMHNPKVNKGIHYAENSKRRQFKMAFSGGSNRR
jgi:hypothetical protein